MDSKELERKVIQSVKEGFSEEEIVSAMRDDGYQEEKIRKVIEQARSDIEGQSQKSMPQNNQDSVNKNESKYPDDSEFQESENQEKNHKELDNSKKGLTHRNPFLVIGLSILTLPLFAAYALYWYYSINSQYKTALNVHSRPILRTIGIFVPFINFYVIYATIKEHQKLMGDESWILNYALFIIFFPAAQYFIQTDINEKAK